MNHSRRRKELDVTCAASGEEQTKLTLLSIPDALAQAVPRDDAPSWMLTSGFLSRISALIFEVLHPVTFNIQNGKKNLPNKDWCLENGYLQIKE